MTKLILTTLAILSSAFGQTDAQIEYMKWNMPTSEYKELKTSLLFKECDIRFDVNPFFQRDDFDGDGVIDLAVLVENKSNGKQGIHFSLSSQESKILIGAGKTFDKRGDDFSWLGVWRVAHPKRTAGLSKGSARGLWVEKPESGGMLIYWDGTNFKRKKDVFDE